VGEFALRLFDPNETGAAQAPPAVEPPQPAPGPRLTVDANTWLRTSDIALALDGPTAEARQRAAERRAGELEAEPATALYIRRESGTFAVSPRTPAGLFVDGEVGTIEDYLAVKRARPPAMLHGRRVGPRTLDAWPTLTEKRRQGLLNDFAFVWLRDEHAAQFRGLSATERNRRFNADPEVRQFAETHGRGHVADLARAADKARRAIENDEITDRRGRPRGPWIPPADLAEIVCGIALNANTFTLTEAIRLAMAQAAEQKLRVPGPKTWARWFRSYYTPRVQRALVKGPKSTEAQLIPRARRALSAAEFMEVVELDGKRLDVMGRYPDLRGGWQRCRGVTLVFAVDVATGYIVGWDIRRGETADGVAATMFMLLTGMGRAQTIRSDNGRAIDAALGERWAAEADGLTAGICNQTGMKRNGPLPDCPFSKGAVERAAGFVSDFERWQATAYWGSSPMARPEERDRETRDDLLALPTEEQIRAAFATWLADVYHATPRPSLNGLSPRLAMEQSRTSIERVPECVAELVCSLPDKKPRLYGRDGITAAGWLFRECDASKHFSLIGRKVVARRAPWTGNYVILTDEAGVVIGKAERVALVGVSATADELREVCREQNRARRVVRRAGAARRYLFGGRAAQLAELKRSAALASEAAARQKLPPPPVPAVTIVAADVATKAELLRATGTGGDGAGPGSTRRSIPSGTERLAALGQTVEPVVLADPGFSYARFGAGCPDVLGSGGGWGARERQDLAREREELLGRPSTGDEPREPVEDATQRQFRLLHELGDDRDWQPPPPLKETLDIGDDFAPDQPEPPAPAHNVFLDLATGDETDSAAAHHVGQGGGYA
jgi:hypothetical protein